MLQLDQPTSERAKFCMSEPTHSYSFHGTGEDSVTRLVCSEWLWVKLHCWNFYRNIHDNRVNRRHGDTFHVDTVIMRGM
ncbi:hypothetical protein Pcinc_023842 [Petrolisthes cinctipes]|uniref:Uncharacterized protein n=1 Tax=Petrolisthes cinctipes TaxID=88211 RepID=A0AAE1FCN5_PETCI|nr:hypothetical protein Pcinc_023842 [Petrolisthes cinctipes]